MVLFVLVLEKCICQDDLPHVYFTKPNIGELGPSVGTQVEVDIRNGLELECIAPYPIEWVLEKFDFREVCFSHQRRKA